MSRNPRRARKPKPGDEDRNPKVLDALDRTDNPYTGDDDPAARTYAGRGERGSEDETDVRNAIKRMVDDAREYGDNDLAPSRERAWRYYNGEVDQKAKKNRSSAVDAVVRDTVDGILPQLVRVFASSNQVARYEPDSGADQEFADQATRFANYVFHKQNAGFRHLHDHLKDGLVGGIGIFRAFCASEVETTEERYEGLSPDEFTMLMGDDVEVIALEQETVPLPSAAPPAGPQPYPVPAAMTPGGPAGMPQPPGPPQPGPPQPGPPPAAAPQSNVVPFTLRQPNIIINCTLRRTVSKKRIVIDTVDPAEFIVDSRATCEDDAYCIGMDAQRPISDVIAMGIDPDEVEDIATAEDEDRTGEKAARRGPQQSSTADGPEGPDDKKADRTIRVVDVIVRYDEDEDGIPERRHIIALGEAFRIVRDEPTDEVPYAVGSPILMPHSIVGQGLGALVADLQDIQTAILRQQLDSLYQAVNPRTIAVEQQVNLQDLVDNQFNGVIRARAPGMVQPYNVEFVGQQAFPMIERLDQIRENRTGLSRASQGLQADALQSSTEVGVRAVIGAALMKIELLARTYAETSIHRLFRMILFLAVRYQMEPMTITVDGKPYEVDPRAWKADMRVEVEVGLGTGNEDERKGTLGMILGLQKEILQTMGPMNPLCDLAGLYNTIKDFLALTPYKNCERYFKLPTPQAMQQFMQQQAEASKKQDDGSAQAKMADVQRKTQEGQEKLKLQQQQGQQQLALKAQQGQQQIALKQQEMQTDAELEQMKTLADVQLAREKAEVEMQTDAIEIQAEAMLEKYKVDKQTTADTRLRKQTP